MIYASKLSKASSLLIVALVLAIVTVIPAGLGTIITAQNELTTGTAKPSYYQREIVTVQGTATYGGVPVSDALVGLEVRDTQANTLAYRTASIGNPSEQWILNITSIKMWDMNFQPINTAKIGQSVLIEATVANLLISPISQVVVTLSLYDGNMVPIQGVMAYSGGIDQRTSVTAAGQFYIPKWAYSGRATVYASVFDRIPSQDGVPYLPEKSAQFYISRTQQGLFSYTAGTTQTVSPPPGTYSSSFRVPPNSRPGAYPVYTTVRYNPIYRATNSSAFSVLYAPSPPTASFVYLPADPYPNQTVTFDASSSSPEGFNDTIIRYAWDFGDGIKVVRTGTPSSPPDPTVTHKFMAVQQYIVTLNVTDTENLWATSSKPVTTKSTNPTAVFSWSPQRGVINVAVTFNASASLPGWSIPKGAVAPIANYTWNFGDGSGSFTVTNPVIQHVFAIEGNFTVTLTVRDTQNQQNSVSHVVQVSNLLYPVWDLNQDGKVDVRDLAIAALAYGSTAGPPPSPNWNPVADVNADGKVDIRDLAIIARHYGEQY